MRPITPHTFPAPRFSSEPSPAEPSQAPPPVAEEVPSTLASTQQITLGNNGQTVMIEQAPGKVVVSITPPPPNTPENKKSSGGFLYTTLVLAIGWLSSAYFPPAGEVIRDLKRWANDQNAQQAGWGDNDFITREQQVHLNRRKEVIANAKNPNMPEDAKLQALAKYVMPATVWIETTGFSGGTGSGAIIHEDGLVLTNAHVVQSMSKDSHLLPLDMKDRLIPPTERVKVTLYAEPGIPKETLEAEVIDVDPINDLAVLRLDSPSVLRKYPALQIAHQPATQGERVVSLGNPLDFTFQFSPGYVTGQGRNADNPRGMSYVQTDANLASGSSGGPLVNLKGEIVAVNVAVCQPDGKSVGKVGLCVPHRAVFDQCRRVTSFMPNPWLQETRQYWKKEITRQLLNTETRPKREHPYVELLPPKFDDAPALPPVPFEDPAPWLPRIAPPLPNEGPSTPIPRIKPRMEELPPPSLPSDPFLPTEPSGPKQHKTLPRPEYLPDPIPKSEEKQKPSSPSQPSGPQQHQTWPRPQFPSDPRYEELPAPPKNPMPPSKYPPRKN